ncbi:MAG: hypothetical protein JST75_16035 [Bacteroidetes bacterium]|nr:hypothetical protein [Bacteroidota bacterium]
MKNYVQIIIISIFTWLSACKNHEQKTTTAAKVEKKEFFPIADYIQSEISYVDSLPLKMMKYVTVNGKRDSGFIKLEDFNILAQEFLPPELKDSAKFEKEFSESSFLDQTTQSLTFTYSTKSDTLQLRRVDVLANRTSGFDKVRSLYMEKNITRNDTTIVKKMYWRAKKSFEIVSLIQPLNQPQSTNHLKIVWDDSE